jgi:GMP synthase (glutamine-hydrolysing)
VKILCIIHAEFEMPGVIPDWAKERKIEFVIAKPYLDVDCLQQPFDCLIVMGGPQSALAIEKDPFLKDEIKLIKQAIKHDKPILGFCLGAQLIGEALGAPTESCPEKEVGVFPIQLTAEGIRDPLLEGFPLLFNVVHWHNDMPGLPKGSVVLAKSEGCPRQIVRFSKKVYGFQCHLEITLKEIYRMTNACKSDLRPSQFTETKETLFMHDYEPINTMMWEILDRFKQICMTK